MNHEHAVKIRYGKYTHLLVVFLIEILMCLRCHMKTGEIGL
jgi:hypothetical protein